MRVTAMRTRRLRAWVALSALTTALVGLPTGTAGAAPAAPAASSFRVAPAVTATAKGLGPVRPLGHRGMRQVGLAIPASAGAVGAAGTSGGVVRNPLRRAVGRAARTGARDGVSESTNWSGQVLTGGTYTGVTGAWQVPTVQPSAVPVYSSSWIGIDGASDQQLIQTGTEQRSNAGGTGYYAWIELIPDAEVPLANAPVAPGDQIAASVTETATNLWTITIEDQTASWYFSQEFSYVAPGLSAEWIEEAPLVGVQSTLADFGAVTFTGMGVTGSGVATSSLVPVALVEGSQTVVAWPGAFDPQTGSFTDFYGEPPPDITSVAPGSGYIGGGTPVTIDGPYVFTATGVSFGGVVAPFRVNGDGTLTATAPPHGLGTVDVVVSNARWSGAVSAADQFTYVATLPPPPLHGYWLVGADGGIFTFGAARFWGSTGNLNLQRPVVGITPTADRGGYWLVATDGGIFAFGDSGFYGSLPGVGLAPAGSAAPDRLNAPVVAMVPSTDGHGYFMVAADGGVFAFGDAQFAGSCPGIGGCSGQAVAVMPDASGGGYWLVTDTGNVYAFGDAPSYGAPGGYGVPVTSAVRTPDGGGYWILYADGNVACFGDAGNFGAPYGTPTPFDPATAIFPTADGQGYWIADAAGDIFSFGNAPDEGSMSGVPLNAPVIAGTGW